MSRDNLETTGDESDSGTFTCMWSNMEVLRPAFMTGESRSENPRAINAQAAQTHYMNAGVTLACERCCATTFIYKVLYGM